MASVSACDNWTRTILTWFEENQRDLPWRSPEVSAWGILISEVMSQQTPVSRVAPVWTVWLERWPRPSNLASATKAEVLRAWGKLGYPRRALRLHQCAVELATHHEDQLPADLDALLALPGIGDYTARAVLAFAYHRRFPVVDTNVRRVIARHCRGMPDQGKPRASDLADASALLPGESTLGAKDPVAAKFSAAIMEFGALVCTARRPQCDTCPIVDSCTWVANGRPEWDLTTHGQRPKTQTFTGTDRQVRGLLMDVLRERSTPVIKDSLDAVWPDPVQRTRALQSLVTDGLVTATIEGKYSLPGDF